MKRREFIALASGVAAWPLVGHAQVADRKQRIGVLIGYEEGDPETKARVAAFEQGLQKRGWSSRTNVQIDYRFAGGSENLFQSFAKELIALEPDVVLAHTTPAAAAVQHERRTVPIVFVNVSDPIGAGFIANLAKPGGRIAAFTQGLRELGWIDGRNIRIDWRWGVGSADSARKYAAELIALAPNGGLLRALLPEGWRPALLWAEHY